MPTTTPLTASLETIIRDAVTRGILGLQRHLASKGLSLPPGKTGRKPGARDYGCIAPRCKAVSKGPRFHYCCAKHLTASAATVAKWRAAKRGA